MKRLAILAGTLLLLGGIAQAAASNFCLDEHERCKRACQKLEQVDQSKCRRECGKRMIRCMR